MYAYRVYAADNQQKTCRKAGDYSPAFIFQQEDIMPRAENTLTEGNKVRLKNNMIQGAVNFE